MAIIGNISMKDAGAPQIIQNMHLKARVKLQKSLIILS